MRNSASSVVSRFSSLSAISRFAFSSPSFSLRSQIVPRSDWRNPYNRAYRDGHITVREAIDLFLYDLVVKRADLVARLPGLRGKTLACWCKPGPCHGDVLVRLAEELG